MLGTKFDILEKQVYVIEKEVQNTKKKISDELLNHKNDKFD
jgi:hypothetical protein